MRASSASPIGELHGPSAGSGPGHSPSVTTGRLEVCSGRRETARREWRLRAAPTRRPQPRRRPQGRFPRPRPRCRHLERVSAHPSGGDPAGPTSRLSGPGLGSLGHPHREERGEALLVGLPDRPAERREHEAGLDAAVLEDDCVDVRAHPPIARKRQRRDNAERSGARRDLREGQPLRRDDLDVLRARRREADDVCEARRRLRRAAALPGEVRIARRPVDLRGRADGDVDAGLAEREIGRLRVTGDREVGFVECVAAHAVGQLVVAAPACREHRGEVRLLEDDRAGGRLPGAGQRLPRLAVRSRRSPRSPEGEDDDEKHAHSFTVAPGRAGVSARIVGEVLTQPSLHDRQTPRLSATRSPRPGHGRSGRSRSTARTGARSTAR